MPKLLVPNRKCRVCATLTSAEFGCAEIRCAEFGRAEFRILHYMPSYDCAELRRAEFACAETPGTENSIVYEFAEKMSVTSIRGSSSSIISNIKENKLKPK